MTTLSLWFEANSRTDGICYCPSVSKDDLLISSYSNDTVIYIHKLCSGIVKKIDTIEKPKKTRSKKK